MSERTLDEAMEIIWGLIWQFGVPGVKENRPIIHSGCLSDMERAFAFVGWDDPHFLTEEEQEWNVCEVMGCPNPRCCGMPWADGLPYLHLCSQHSASARKGELMPVIKRHAEARESFRNPETHQLAPDWYKRIREVEE